jgi:FAD/FMN-containing dehydrogenase
MALARTPASEPGRPFDFSAFTAGISGTVILPDDPAFATARLGHNRRFEGRPSFIVRAANAADVASTVVFARDHGLEIAVRGGSHSVAGHSTVNGGVIIDLSALKGLYIDPDRRLAWAGAGLTAGEITEAAAAHGLAVPFGDNAHVGIGGLTTGGGIGWLVRKHGLTIDSLVSADVVTADGRLVTASEHENPDLFWAIRGGGGNFGIITRFQYRLHPVDTILGGVLFLPLSHDVVRSIVPIAASAPEELTTIAFVMAAPPAPFVPEEVQGRPSVALMFVYAGDPADGEAAIAPFRAVATPMAELVAPMPYPGIYAFTEEGETPGPWVTRSLFVDTLDEATVDAIVRAHEAPSSPYLMTEIRVLGGAMARVPVDATAFAHRDAPIMLAVINPFEDPAEAPIHEAWTAAYYEAMRHGSVGVYSNFLEDEGDARIREAYPSATYERLAAIKRRYDPTNLFHRNQNIRPTTAS